MQLQRLFTYANNRLELELPGSRWAKYFYWSLGNYLISLGKKVAVLAVDPSSSVSHGSILEQNPNGRIGKTRKCL